MPSTLCALCSSDEKLKQSHVVPRFVYRALKQPDGPSRPLLCGACEDRFSLWESQFARDVFHPLVAGRAVPVKYGPWLLKFAASVGWRVLENARRENQLGAIQADDCLKIWSDFLRDRRPDVGPHYLYLLRPEKSGRIEGKVTDDIVRVQLGPIILSGLMSGALPGEGSGTRINREGKLKWLPGLAVAAVCLSPAGSAKADDRRSPG